MVRHVDRMNRKWRKRFKSARTMKGLAGYIACALALILSCLAGCAGHPFSNPHPISPVQHRAIHALIGATIVFGGDYVGINPTLSLAFGTVGKVAVSKAVMVVRHPDWFGSWTPGDVACDVVASSAVFPVWAGKHLARAGRAWDWRAAVLSGLGWGAAMIAVDQWCIP